MSLEKKELKKPFSNGYAEKLKKKSLPQLLKKAQEVFNAYIRTRDKGLPCINCGQYKELQAGHFFSAGQYSGLRFNENNCSGECKSCNYFNSQSHAYGYRSNLIKRIGQEAFDKLEFEAAYYKRHGKKWQRFELIEIILKYKNLPNSQ